MSYLGLTIDAAGFETSSAGGQGAEVLEAAAQPLDKEQGAGHGDPVEEPEDSQAVDAANAEDDADADADADEAGDEDLDD